MVFYDWLFPFIHLYYCWFSIHPDHSFPSSTPPVPPISSLPQIHSSFISLQKEQASLIFFIIIYISSKFILMLERNLNESQIRAISKDLNGTALSYHKANRLSESIVNYCHHQDGWVVRAGQFQHSTWHPYRQIPDTPQPQAMRADWRSPLPGNGNWNGKCR